MESVRGQSVSLAGQNLLNPLPGENAHTDAPVRLWIFISPQGIINTAACDYYSICCTYTGPLKHTNGGNKQSAGGFHLFTTRSRSSKAQLFFLVFVCFFYNWCFYGFERSSIKPTDHQKVFTRTKKCLNLVSKIQKVLIVNFLYKQGHTEEFKYCFFLSYRQ